jgi:hypothetical protein
MGTLKRIIIAVVAVALVAAVGVSGLLTRWWGLRPATYASSSLSCQYAAYTFYRGARAFGALSPNTSWATIADTDTLMAPVVKTVNQRCPADWKSWPFSTYTMPTGWNR